MCATACEFRSTCFFKSPDAYSATENQPRSGCLRDRAYGLAPGPWAPEAGG